MRLVLATRNEHKAREFAVLLAPHEVHTLPDEVVLPPETGTTFADNALGKARAAAQTLGVPVIADDSGIEAAALGGAPGVLSARFAGPVATDEENLDRLLREAPAGSAVAYVCAIAYVDPTDHDRHEPLERVFEGRCTGTLDHEPRGSGGFGYDPAFVPDDAQARGRGPRPRTMAELSVAEKDAISHRGHAAREFLAWLTTR